jgi:lysophospholipase L1-like esterase
MNSVRAHSFVCTLLFCVNIFSSAAEPDAADWVEPMKKVHARFTGTKGTFAEFGDSITFTMAFWSPMAAQPKHMNEEMARAHALVTARMKPECWSKWKGPEFGNQGSMTIRWAHAHVDEWLAKMNPEVAVLMFGSNDVGQMDASDYEQTTREVVQRCLRNGTIVLLTTAPPRSRRADKCKNFADAVRRIAREERVPLIDYHGEILKHRPEDWDGTLPQFKQTPGDEYQVPTLIARDGLHPSNSKPYVNDFSEEALKCNGFTLRNYLTLRAYADVIRLVLKD